MKKSNDNLKFTIWILSVMLCISVLVNIYQNFEMDDLIELKNAYRDEATTLRDNQ